MFEGVNDIIFKNPSRIVSPLNWVEHIPFAFKLVEVLKPSVIVELGVHSGNSFCAFNQAVKMLNLHSKCFGIDTWLGDTQAGFYDSDVYDSLSKYVKEQYQESAILMKCTFDEGLDAFEDYSIDILHFDGLHEYHMVSSDYHKWKRKLSNSGVILFHDTQVEYDSYGVKKFWREIQSDFKVFEFTNCHGLGVLLYGSNPSMDIVNMFDYLQNNSEYIHLLQLIGSQIFYYNKSIDLEIKVNQLVNLNEQYLNSSSYKLGKKLISPLNYFKKL
jgi:Methyltransferase domain